MKKAFGTLAALLCMVLVAYGDASQQLPVIDVTDKAAIESAKGTRVIVQGKVSLAEWSHTGKVMNIEFEGAPHFMAVVFERNRAKFDAGFNGDVAKALTGAVVRFNGEIGPYGGHTEKYKDAYQMILSAGGQITIVTPASQPASE